VAIDETDRPWRYCGDPDCEVVYFDPGGVVIEKSALAVRVGEKEKDPPHTVCYCFGHTVEGIRDEVRRTGRSTVVASITAKVKAGECSCETKNPKGACCLGDVNREVKSALAAGPPSTSMSEGHSTLADAEDCCAVPAASAPTRAPRPGAERAGLLAAGASVLTAVASSACCWLPLLLIALGASAGGVAAAFERFRPVFLVVAPLLLALGFYFLYLRKPTCGPDGTCAAPNPRIRRLSRVMFWVAAVLVAAFAFFPKYVGLLLPASSDTGAADTAGPTRTVVLRIEGMTCEACATRLEAELSSVPGVRRVKVAYPDGAATVHVDPAAREVVASLLERVRNAGYEARVESGGPPP
jgi:copper chaperone CopZ